MVSRLYAILVGENNVGQQEYQYDLDQCSFRAQSGAVNALWRMMLIWTTNNDTNDKSMTKVSH